MFRIQDVTQYPNKAHIFKILYYTSLQMRTVKLMQVDRFLSAFTTSPAETRSINSGRYTLLESHIPWENTQECNFKINLN